MLHVRVSLAVLGLVVISLVGCSDWYLRGTRTNAVAIKSAYVSASRAPKLHRAVIRELTRSGVTRASKKDAEATIELFDEEFDRRVLSVDPDTGKVREIELGLEVRFSVRAKDGKLLVPPERLTWVQSFIFDESSLLGTVEKASTIQRELSEDAAQTILLRLETVEIASSNP